MRYSIQPRERRYVKGYGYLSFAKVAKFAKNLNNKFGQKLVDNDTLKIDTLKIASKRAIQKTAEATADLVGYKIADKITSYSKKCSDRSTELNSNESNNKIPKERYISPQERQKVIDELGLI